MRYLTVTLLLLLQTTFVAAEMVDKVVAVVNDDIITLSELEAETASIYKVLSKSNSSENLTGAMEEARQLALDKMIDRTLMEQKAKQYNLTVPKEEIDAAYEHMRSNMSLSDSEFREKLEASGMTEEDYRSKLHDNILQSKILSVDVRSKIVVTDEMVLEYYDQHYTSKVSEGDYYLLQIGFSWNNTNSEDLEASKDRAYKLAQRVHKLAEEGQDFKALAKKFSDLPSASDGGDIGIFTLDEMAEAMRSAVKDLNPGELSPIVEIQSGYQFFKLLSGDSDAIVVTSSYEKNKEEIREKLYEAKMQEAYQDWVKKLKESAYIQKL
jgi:peptidyl-prolyl cis-trans isomerase SurA